MPRRKPELEKKRYYSPDEISSLIEETLAQFDLNKVHWLTEEEYAKAKTQLRMQMTGIFDFMKVDDKLPVRYMYGLGDFVQGAIEECISLTEDFGLRVRGIDKAISIELVRIKILNGIGNGGQNNYES